MGTILGASYYQLKYCLRNKLRQATGDPDFLYRHYVGKPFYDTDALNTYTAELIKSGRPFMMGRFGAVELFNMRVAEFHMENKKPAISFLPARVFSQMIHPFCRVLTIS